MFALTVAVAVGIPVLAVAIVLLLTDAYLQEVWAQMPAQDPARVICAEQRFKEWAREGRLELDPVTGHGRDYDRAWMACGGEPDEVIGQSTMAMEESYAARPTEP